MTIYLDELFLVNFTADYLLIAAAAALSSTPLRRTRFLLAALLGALYSTLAVFPALAFLGGTVFRLAAALLITLAAFGFGSPQRLLRRSAVFFLAGFAFAGFLELLYGQETPVPPAAVLIASTVLAYGLLSFFLRFAPALSAAPKEEKHICIATDWGSAECSALGDTGNGLRDPFTGDPVLILSLEACKNLLPPGIPEILQTRGSLAALEKCGQSFRLIPYRSIGGDGFLLALRPRSLTVNGKVQKHMLAAFTCSTLSESTGCSGIIGI